MREFQQASTVFCREIRAFLALVLAAIVAATPAHGLVRFNDGHDQVIVAASVGVSRDSNIFASSADQGDFIYSTELIAEYTRRAGWIGVNASVGVSGSHFATVKGQDFSNPAFSMELTKQSGRTTGSLTMSAARQSRADAAANLRSTSWNYNAGLNFAYPVIERFKIAGQLGYSAQKQIDNADLVNLATYTAGLNLFYVYNTERDLLAGYRYRYTETSRSNTAIDHDFSAGMSGRIIRGLNGSVRAGYQVRIPQGAANPNHDTFSGLSVSAATQYALNRKMTLTGQLSKDFSTTSTDSSVDTGAADLGLKYAYSSKWSFIVGVGVGDSHFLGPNGRVVIAVGPPPIYGAQRHDTFLHYDALLSYARSEHFKLSLSYGWFRNWSTLSFADFVRSNWNLHFDTRL